MPFLILAREIPPISHLTNRLQATKWEWDRIERSTAVYEPPDMSDGTPFSKRLLTPSLKPEKFMHRFAFQAVLPGRSLSLATRAGAFRGTDQGTIRIKASDADFDISHVIRFEGSTLKISQALPEPSPAVRATSIPRPF